jgi:two-component system sensor kinase FixL
MERLWKTMEKTALPQAPPRLRARPYLYAALLICLGAIARLALEPLLGDRVVFLFFVPAVVVASATGGLVPGLAITALSSVVGVTLLNRHGVILGNEIDGVLFTSLGGAIAYGGGRMLKAQSAAAEMNRQVLEREAQLQAVLDTVPDAMIVTDEQGRVQSFSPSAEKLLQWTRSEVMGQNLSRLMPSRDRDADDPYLEVSARTGERRVFGQPRVGTACRKDGSEFPAELYVGETTARGRHYFLGFLRDLTETRRELLAAELEREAQLQSLLDTVPDAMIVIDERGLVTSFSPSAEKLFQWTRGEVIGQNVSRLMPGPDHDAHDSYLERYARTGERRVIGLPRIITARRKDGSEFPAELCVGETVDGGRNYYLGFVRDLTETRLQLLHYELGRISRLSIMGEMAAALAHELNQPLAASSNFLKGGQRLLQRENPQSRALPAMNKAVDQTLRAGEIIRRLRDFVTVGDGHREVESLRKLMEDARALAFVGAHEHRIAAKADWDPAVDAVFVDKVQVQQVMLNLVRNAIDAMEDTELRELHTATRHAENGMAMVSISDTGRGINPKIADQLFQPFVTTKADRGTGVGLSICRTIVEAHGGRIWIEPNLPCGTTFHFTLPRAEHGEAA